MRLLRGIEYLWNRPVLVALVLVFPTLFFGYHLKHLRFDLREQAMFNPDDPELLFYQNEYVKQFDAVEYVGMGVEASHIFETNVLETIDRITQKMEKIQGVDFVISLTNQEVPLSGKAGVELFSVSNQLSGMSPDRLKEIQERVLKVPLFRKALLISKDQQASFIWAYLDSSSPEALERLSIVQKIRRIADSDCSDAGIKCYVGGTPHTEWQLRETFKEDSLTVIPMMLFLLILMLYLLFKSWKIVLMSVFIVSLGTVWSFGFSALVSYPVTVLTQSLLIIFLGYGVLDVVHMVSHYRFLSKKIPRNEAIRKTMKEIGPACFFNTLTAFLGIIALSAADLAVIQRFGVVAAFGIAVILPITFLIWVFALRERDVESPSAPQSRIEGFIAENFLYRLSRIVIRIPGLIFLLGVLLMGFFIWGTGRLRVDTQYDRLFREDTEFAQGIQYANRHYGGWVPAWIILDTGKPHGIGDAQALKVINDLETYLEGMPEVGETFSIVDPLKTFYQSLQGLPPEDYRLPDQGVSRLYGLFEGFAPPDLFRTLASKDFSKAGIWVSLKVLPAGQAVTFLKDVESYANKLLPPPMKVKVTGIHSVEYRLVDLLLSSQVKSFVTAFLAISLVLIFVFRSFALALLALLPNFFPIIAVLGLMGGLGINLDVGTAMIAAILFGVVVDDTIHWTWRFKREIKEGKSYEEAIRQTFLLAGRPIIFTSLILAVGFSVLGFSGYLPVARFGLLSSFAIVMALLGDLFLLPASMILFKPLRPKGKPMGKTPREKTQSLMFWLSKGPDAPHIFLRVTLVTVLGLCVISFSVLGWVQVPAQPVSGFLSSLLMFRRSILGFSPGWRCLQR